MGQKTANQVKSYFVTGAFPTQGQFEDLIDSKQQTLVNESGDVVFKENADGTTDVDVKYKIRKLSKNEWDAMSDADKDTDILYCVIKPPVTVVPPTTNPGESTESSESEIQTLQATTVSTPKRNRKSKVL